MTQTLALPTTVLMTQTLAFANNLSAINTKLNHVPHNSAMNPAIINVLM